MEAIQQPPETGQRRAAPWKRVGMLSLLTFLVLSLVLGSWFASSWLEENEWEEKYVGLEEDYSVLQDEYAESERDNRDLGTELSQIKAANLGLTNDLSSALKDNAELTNDLSIALAGYAEIREQVALRAGSPDGRCSFVTPDDPDVSALVLQITGGFSEDPSEQWADRGLIFDWVVNNICYSHDSRLPLLPVTPSPESLLWRMDYWREPSETLEDKTGDCEDMATLLASMLINYDGYRCWVITCRSETFGHAAVAFPVEGGYLGIMDPVGDYCTSYLGYKTVSAAVDEWFTVCSTEPGAFVEEVFSNTEHEEFSSTEEFVDWVLT